MKRLFFSLLVLVGLFVAGCRPKIGDKCVANVDCAPDANTIDRICDTTSPDGYCLISDCSPDTCPPEASCVAFRGGAFTFCMAACQANEECRGPEYECVPSDPSGNAVIIDTVSREDGATGFCGVVASGGQ
jgi:hypothetical protein